MSTTATETSVTGRVPADDAVVETAGLVKHFGEVHAVNGVDLAVPRHSIFGFLGPNGAGKTTTIKMLVGLLHPTAGSARILGLDVTSESLALRRKVGFLPQQPVFYEDMSARQTLAYAGRFFDLDRSTLTRRIDETLDVVGLAARADRPVAGFSGGERQRLGLAQAQLHDPELLVLDEPAAGLDPLGRRDVLELLERLRERCTVLYSTHILDDVQRVSDTVAIIRDGIIIAQGPIDGMLDHPDGTTYRIELTGPADRLLAALEAEPWVTGVDAGAVDGHTSVHLAVNDQQAADQELLRAIVDEPDVTVVSYGRHRRELEDVFVELIEREGDR